MKIPDAKTSPLLANSIISHHRETSLLSRVCKSTVCWEVELSNNTKLGHTHMSMEVFGIRQGALIITLTCLVRVQLSSMLRSTFLACFASVTSRRLGILPNEDLGTSVPLQHHGS